VNRYEVIPWFDLAADGESSERDDGVVQVGWRVIRCDGSGVSVHVVLENYDPSEVGRMQSLGWANMRTVEEMRRSVSATVPSYDALGPIRRRVETVNPGSLKP